jgi:hypothetical protein
MKQVNGICFKRMVATSSLLFFICNSMHAQKDELSLNKTLSPYFVAISVNLETNLLLEGNRVKAYIIGLKKTSGYIW